jgi:hypothetical protein
MGRLLLIRLLRSSQMQPEVAAGDFQESVPKFQELVLGRELQEERVFTNRPASLRTIQSREMPVAAVVSVSSWPISVGDAPRLHPFTSDFDVDTETLSCKEKCSLAQRSRLPGTLSN